MWLTSIIVHTVYWKLRYWDQWSYRKWNIQVQMYIQMINTSMYLSAGLFTRMFTKKCVRFKSTSGCLTQTARSVTPSSWITKPLKCFFAYTSLQVLSWIELLHILLEVPWFLQNSLNFGENCIVYFHISSCVLANYIISGISLLFWATPGLLIFWSIILVSALQTC